MRRVERTMTYTDWYKMTMGAAVQRFYPNVYTRFAFTNRNTDFPLAKYVDEGELRERLAGLRDLRLTLVELEHLSGLGVLPPAFLTWLMNYRMPEIEVERVGDQYRIECEGLWSDVLPVEVHVLGIVTELASEALRREMGLSMTAIWDRAHAGWSDLIDYLRAHPDVKLAPFGARRHFSTEVEYEGTRRLVEEVPDSVVGISNVQFARQFDRPLSGTIAHEVHMIPAMLQIGLGTLDPIRAAQYEIMDHWEQLYGDVWDGGILCALPDTFGTDVFLDNLTYEQALRWKTFRQDSGDPQAFVSKSIARWREFDIDPATRRIVHADALDIPRVESIRSACQSRYIPGYGMGTHHSNNVGVPTHSVVWKPKSVKLPNGIIVPCAKLTDNVAKACGDPDMIKYLIELVHYRNTYAQTQNA